MGLTKRMTILYLADDPHPCRVRIPMFSRWGAFVYRFRRPIVLVAVIVAIASCDARDPDLVGPVGRRLARRQFRIGRRLRPARHRVRRRQELGHRALPFDDAGADAKSAEFQGAIKTATAGARRPCPQVTGDHRLRRDRRHALHQHGRRRRLHRRRARRDRRGVGRRSSTTSGRRSCRRPATPTS